MNMRGAFLGQVPMAPPPQPWPIGQWPYNFTPGSGSCPPGTWRDEDGSCRPRTTMGVQEPWGPPCESNEVLDANGYCRPPYAMSQSILQHFDVPLGAFPVPWGMGCKDGEVQDKHGRCVPDTYYMGNSQMTREGSVLEHFEVPLGAMPVPWNLPCMPGEVRDQDGVCRPDTGAMMGQAQQAGCEKTAEGGMRCPDGTYIPPEGGTIKAAPPPSGFPWLPVAVGAGAVAAGIALLGASRRRMGQDFGLVAPNVETAYPTQFAQLTDLASRIDSERASDAFNFQQYLAAGKKRLDLVYKQKDAETALNEQTRLWEALHRNQDQLVAAQQTYDQVTADLAAAGQETQMYRDAINQNQANIMTYRQNADVIIASLPDDVQAEARKIIDSYPSSTPAMRGGIRAVPLMRGRF